MNVSQTTRAWVLACVSNLLIVQGISANPPVTLQTETQSVSNLGSNTHLRSRRAPRVCALLTLCCSRAVRGCVPGMEWRVKEPDVPPPRQPPSPGQQLTCQHLHRQPHTSVGARALLRLPDSGQVTTSVSLLTFPTPLQDRGAAPGSGSWPCRLVCIPARVGTQRHRQAWIWPRPKRRPPPLRPGQRWTDPGGFLCKPRL